MLFWEYDALSLLVKLADSLSFFKNVNQINTFSIFLYIVFSIRFNQKFALAFAFNSHFWFYFDFLAVNILLSCLDVHFMQILYCRLYVEWNWGCNIHSYIYIICLLINNLLQFVFIFIITELYKFPKV